VNECDLFDLLLHMYFIAVSDFMSIPEAKEPPREEDAIDLRAFRPAGGPLILQAFELPPQPKRVKTWTIKKGLSVIMILTVTPLNGVS